MSSTGKSAALLMRKIRPEARAAAQGLAVQEICDWFGSWSLSGKTVFPSLLEKVKADLAERSASISCLDAASPFHVNATPKTCIAESPRLLCLLLDVLIPSRRGKGDEKFPGGAGIQRHDQIAPMPAG